MVPIQPKLKWYTEISASKNLSSPRCPFASVHRCPRYYASVSLLGEWGVGTAIAPEEDKRLMERWQRSDLWPVVVEQDTAIMGRKPGNPSLYSNFCPEVSFDRFGLFASSLGYYADEIDSDVAAKRLSKEHASSQDWRWYWAHVNPMHYTDCPLYSPLLLGVNDVKNRGTIGFGL